ncbi:hypothetical protein Mal15_42490 [Stieleria maiorica]|uniref:SCP domain-containing protein n=2 Tax=Stieleria maiorica TaxID=2795974 RepID=A0A5B9MI54_9BACT|nr:hypothetical protein Mal15_42490 [Stieleria maiorica]
MNRIIAIFAFSMLAVPSPAHATDRSPESRGPRSVGRPAGIILTSETAAKPPADDAWKAPAYARIIVPSDAKVFVDGSELNDRGPVRWYKWTPSKDQPSKNVTLTATWQDRVTQARKKHTRKIVMRPGKIRCVILCGASLESIVDGVIWRTNLQRQHFGIAPLVENPMLTAAVQKHAHHLSRQKKLTHQLNGKGFLSRSRREGYHLMTGGENIAEGAWSFVDVVEMWIRLQGHRRNILSREFT